LFEQGRQKGKNMNQERDSHRQWAYNDSITVTKERLNGVKADLISLFCQIGSNIYILSYENYGVRRHTLIDTGDSRYQNRIISVLTESDINPANIERIIITHGHPDHYGLVNLLTKASRAKVLVHSSFGHIPNNEAGQGERRWSGSIDSSLISGSDLEYLHESETSEVVNIGRVGFVKLTKTIEIGQGGRLEILGCPQTVVTHSPDQIVVLYSPRDDPHPHEQTNGGFRPTDDIIFSGDLWLMRGPMFYPNMIRPLVFGGGIPRRDPRNQDFKVKEALKKGFCLIRVKPGHGPEFLGTRILPLGLLAEQDILVELGYPLDASKTILGSAELAPKVHNMREQAYITFSKELVHWEKLGYTLEEIVELLARIYTEQSGGGSLVEEDRKERRELLKATLARLKEDKEQPDWIHQLAIVSQTRLKSILYYRNYSMGEESNGRSRASC
jgi:glyoxylase-like metal-dependent hydrolase (beta-lactamase superfamily II)